MDEVRIAKVLSREQVKIVYGTESSEVPVWVKDKTPKTQLIVHPFLLLKLYK